MDQPFLVADSCSTLICIWRANPASGKLECRWLRPGAPTRRPEKSRSILQKWPELFSALLLAAGGVTRRLRPSVSRRRA